MNLFTLTKKLHRLGVEVNRKSRLTLGNNANDVFRAKNTDTNAPLVVKVGTTEHSAKEIKLNMEGYAELENMGAGKIIPEYRKLVTIESIPVLIMSDCGSDFYHAVRDTDTPLELYKLLAKHLLPLYQRTLRRTEDSYAFGKTLKSLLQRAYGPELQKLISVPADLISQINDWKPDGLGVNFESFSTFNFTPEDTFVSVDGLKFVDPIPPFGGVPVLDMACFSGVAEALKLPAATAGGQILKRFAIEDVSQMFEISQDTARSIFEIGRAIQLGFSARQRHKEGKEKLAEEFLRQGHNRVQSYCL